MRGLRTFGLGLRIAGRSSRKMLRRSLLLTAFIAVPLALATFVSTLTSTAVPSPEEFATRGLGAATMRAELPGQDLPADEALTRGSATIRGLVPAARDVEPVISQDSRLAKGGREVAGSSFGLNGASHVHDGRFTIEQGVLPSADGEVAVSSALARRLVVDLGGTVTVDGRELTVAGVVVDRADITRTFAIITVPTAIAVAIQAPNAAGMKRPPTIAWHLTGVDPYAARKALEDAGWRALTRDDFGTKGTEQMGQLPTLTLGLTLLALALATLLVGAGFAVAASSSRREIGLLAASGASPAQRRLVLTCNGFVLGVIATVVGLGAGLGLAAIAYPRVGRSLDQLWTGLRVDTVMLVMFAVVGLGGPVAAAWLAGRQTAGMDPWTALHERPSAIAVRAVRHTRRWTMVALVVAVLLLGLAALSADVALTALAALVTVVAAAATIRVAVPWLSLWAAGAPPGMRVALRSHAASPGRGAALVAAIGAVVTVAGLVMLGAGGLAERSAAAYRPTAPDGSTVIDTYDTLPATTVTDMARRLDATGVARINLAMSSEAKWPDTYLISVDNPAAGCYRNGREDPRVCLERAGFPDTNFWYLGIVDLEQMAVILGRPLTDAEATAYREGTAIVLSDQVVFDGVIRTLDRDPRAEPNRQPDSHPAIVAKDVRVYSEIPFAYISPDGARTAGFKNHHQVQYLIRSMGRPTEAAEDSARSLLAADSGGYGRLYVERGDPATRQLGTVLMTCAIILLALAAVVSVLAVGLAGGELAPEFATLAAMGATTRFRRALTAAYSAVTATLGVLLGLLALAAISPAQTRAMEVPVSSLAWLLLLGTGVVAVVIAAAGGWVTSPRPASLVRRMD